MLAAVLPLHVAAADSAVGAKGAPLLWNGTFEAGNLSSWPVIEGDVQIVTKPTFKSKFAAKITTTNAPDTSISGDSSFLQTGSSQLPWEMNGSNAWYRIQVYLPRGKFKPAGSSAGWDMFMEWHNSSGCVWAACKEYSPYFGVAKDGKRLMMRWVGGESTKPKFTTINARAKLKYNYWYDVVMHVVLSPDPAIGSVRWWVDGRLLASWRLATLFRRPDGTVSATEFKVGHYRATERTVDVCYIDGVKVGPTAKSIGFNPNAKPRRR